MPTQSPRWALVRSEPYRLFFPLGVALGACGVAHWLLFATGVLGRYLALFHAITQTQAFLLAFAAGFLMTALPRRTRTQPASMIEIGALALLLPSVSIAAFFGNVVAAELAYVVSLLVLAAFAVRRFLARTGGRRPPTSFVLIPIGLASGLAGAVMFAVGARPGGSPVAFAFGRALVFEGVFSCLVLGIGSFFLPLALRGEAAADYDGSPATRRALLGYAFAGLALVGGLAVELGGHQQLGLFFRGLIAVLVLVMSGAWRAPTRPGVNRRLVWVAPWCLPLGLLLAAAFPEHRIAAMHIAFIGGFGLLAFAVAAHVTIAHATAAERPEVRWPVLAFGALFFGALALRALATALVRYYVVWLGSAAALWLAGAIAWAVFVLPRAWSRPPADSSAP